MVKKESCSPPTPPPNLFDFLFLLFSFFFRSLSVSSLSLFAHFRDQKEEPTYRISHAATPTNSQLLSLYTKIRALASHFEHCSFIPLKSESLFVTPFSASSNVQNASQPEILARSEADRKFAGDLMESERFSFQCSLFHGANRSVHLMRAVQISLQTSIRRGCFRGNSASSCFFFFFYLL